MREEVERKRDAIRKRVEERGQSDGSVITTKKDVYWLVCQAAKDGIMLNVAEDPAVYQKGNECYYFYAAMSVNADKKKVRDFVDTYPLMTTGVLDDLLNETKESSEVENIKKIRRLIQARDRRHRKRKREREREMAELKEKIRIEAQRQQDFEEAAANCNNLTWLVERIESLGWEVTLRRKSDNEPKKK